MKNNKFFLGIVLCLVAVVSWGGMFPVMASALKIIDPFYFTLIRFFIAMVVMIILLVLIEGKKSFALEGQGIKLWLLGTAGFTGFGFLVFLGQKLAGPSGTVIAAVIMAIQPLLGILVNWVAKKGTPKPITVLFMLTGLLGVVMVISKGDLSVFFAEGSHLYAYFIILLGALSFVLYTIGSSAFSHWSTLRYSTITTAYGCMSNLIIVGIATLFGWLNIPSVSAIITISPHLLYMSLIAGVLGFFVWNAGNRIVTPINGILFMNMVPITAFIISLIQGYHLTTFEFIGLLITICSLIGNNIYIRYVNSRVHQSN